LARLYLCLKDFSAALKANRLCLENISLESNSILCERLQNKNFSFIAENKNKQELISFLFYNNAALLEKIKITDESSFVYRKGYEFSLSTLGELSYLTNKFKPKLSSNRSSIAKNLRSYGELRRKSFDFRFENSDFDCDFNDASLVKNNEKYYEKNIRNVEKGKIRNVTPVNEVCFLFI